MVDIAHALSKYPSSIRCIIVIEARSTLGETRKMTAEMVTILLSKKNSTLFQKLILLNGKMTLKNALGKSAPRDVAASSIDLSIFFIFVIVDSIPSVKLATIMFRIMMDGL